MKVLITGATGFIGKRLARTLSSDGHGLVILSRYPDQARSAFPFPVAAFGWRPEREIPPGEAFAGTDALVHLAGEGIANRRWSASQKKKIYNSRILGTRHLIQMLRLLQDRPRTLVAASAIGYYGYHGDEELTEQSAPGTGFLPETCRDWEKEAETDLPDGPRLVKLRIGVVLGPEGGMLKRLLPLFKLGLGGPVGRGKQWISWIHADDLARLILFALKNPGLKGAVNGVAPNPVTNAQFSKALGRALRRPAFFIAPPFGMKLAFGEMAELILGSQRVKPQAALASGFQFAYPTVNDALAEIFQKKL
ncbi:MAG: TIGR01777 family protein [Planctomycetes bacterium]|nr:TIGR01777 family protein [Planctomycetota bacterium]